MPTWSGYPTITTTPTSCHTRATSWYSTLRPKPDTPILMTILTATAVSAIPLTHRALLSYSRTLHLPDKRLTRLTTVGSSDPASAGTDRNLHQPHQPQRLRWHNRTPFSYHPLPVLGISTTTMVHTYLPTPRAC